jgi:hypothetical protein
VPDTLQGSLPSVTAASPVDAAGLVCYLLFVWTAMPNTRDWAAWGILVHGKAIKHIVLPQDEGASSRMMLSDD